MRGKGYNFRRGEEEGKEGNFLLEGWLMASLSVGEVGECIV